MDVDPSHDVAPPQHPRSTSDLFGGLAGVGRGSSDRTLSDELRAPKGLVLVGEVCDEQRLHRA